MTSPRPTRGAVAVREPKKKPLGWLIPVALLLLLAILAITALVLLNANDNGDDPGLDVTDDPQAQTSEGSSTGTGSGSTGDSESAAGQSDQGSSTTMADQGSGTLTADGTALLPAPSDGYESLEGASATGKGVTVESVVADEGFWVGDDATDRFFVHLSEEARTSEGESPFQVEAGQKIDVKGTVTANPDDLTPFGVDEDEGAAQLREQGYFIEAEQIALS
ncbi:MAG: hypothetical protein JWO77_3071 [Ilumatobacteraceae bacterium]|nr:hypothetical protein [Ilumatobacteraceae bacterium]